MITLDKDGFPLIEPRKPKLSGWSKSFEQDADSCDSRGDSGQDIEIEQHDAGGGPYFTIATDRWAFESIEDVVALLREAGVRETAP